MALGNRQLAQDVLNNLKGDGSAYGHMASSSGDAENPQEIINAIAENLRKRKPNEKSWTVDKILKAWAEIEEEIAEEDGEDA